MKKTVAVLLLGFFAVLPVLSFAQTTGDSDEGIQRAGWLFGAGILGAILIFLIGILTFVFWVMMIVHAIKHPIDNKPLWLILILVTGFVGAIVYYFAVKRGYNPAAAPANAPPTDNQPPMDNQPPASTPTANMPPSNPMQTQ